MIETVVVSAWVYAVIYCLRRDEPPAVILLLFLGVLGWVVNRAMGG